MGRLVGRRRGSDIARHDLPRLRAGSRSMAISRVRICDPIASPTEPHDNLSLTTETPASAADSDCYSSLICRKHLVKVKTDDPPASCPAGRRGRLPRHVAHARRRHRRRGARPARAPARAGVCRRRHGRRGHRHASACPAAPAPSTLQGLHRGIAGAAADAARRAAVRRGRGAARRRSRSTAAPATSSASIAPSSRRSSSCAATTAASSVPAQHHRARRAGGHQRLLARPQLRAEGRAAADGRRGRAPRAGA